MCPDRSHATFILPAALSVLRQWTHTGTVFPRVPSPPYWTFWPLSLDFAPFCPLQSSPVQNCPDHTCPAHFISVETSSTGFQSSEWSNCTPRHVFPPSIACFAPFSIVLGLFGIPNWDQDQLDMGFRQIPLVHLQRSNVSLARFQAVSGHFHTPFIPKTCTIEPF